MTAEDKQIQDLRMEIDKLKAELEKSKKDLEESKELLRGTFVIRSILASSVAKFIEHPERFEYKEVRQ
jgi:hypothetical protein